MTGQNQVSLTKIVCNSSKLSNYQRCAHERWRDETTRARECDKEETHDLFPRQGVLLTRSIQFCENFFDERQARYFVVPRSSRGRERQCQLGLRLRKEGSLTQRSGFFSNRRTRRICTLEAVAGVGFVAADSRVDNERVAADEKASGDSPTQHNLEMSRDRLGGTFQQRTGKD